MGVKVFVLDGVAELFGLDESMLARYAETLLSSTGVGNRTVNIIFMDDAAMTELNTRYRGREGTTDVLSFILSETGEDPFVGEIYISLERADVQACEFDVSVADETLRLVTHGLLHLAGRFHNTQEDYELMMRETDDYMQLYDADDGCA